MNHNLSCFNFHSHFKLSLSQNKIKSNFRIPHKLSAVGAKFSRTKHKSVPAGTWIHHAALHSCFHLTSNYRALLFKCDFFLKEQTEQVIKRKLFSYLSLLLAAGGFCCFLCLIKHPTRALSLSGFFPTGIRQEASFEKLTSW